LAAHAGKGDSEKPSPQPAKTIDQRTKQDFAKTRTGLVACGRALSIQ
jgi:hypothetical protein